ncbi:hypothetical protein [Paraliomyxa miuraensis]|uniref:hypothetical protein n=1 Tax=Paraliomyxa miuraensis TaxID=376150 RepID=UPI00225AE999|nr:hypothetical protein [Paraliomyxa miuraensis]MCX4248131.1 hypothetical protein [Paraliomyxa miuraensis]
MVALLEKLKRIALEHEEVTDTDVRESMHLALNCYFVWGQDRSRFPRSFGMFSAEGDLLIARAIREFLDAAEQSSEISRIPVGQARLDVLQAESAVTADGMLYDEFIGHRDTPLPAEPLPEHMFADGDYEE